MDNNQNNQINTDALSNVLTQMQDTPNPNTPNQVQAVKDDGTPVTQQQNQQPQQAQKTQAENTPNDAMQSVSQPSPQVQNQPQQNPGVEITQNQTSSQNQVNQNSNSLPEGVSQSQQSQSEASVNPGNQGVGVQNTQNQQTNPQPQPNSNPELEAPQSEEMKPTPTPSANLDPKSENLEKQVDMDSQNNEMGATEGSDSNEGDSPLKSLARKLSNLKSGANNSDKDVMDQEPTPAPSADLDPKPENIETENDKNSNQDISQIPGVVGANSMPQPQTSTASPSGMDTEMANTQSSNNEPQNAVSQQSTAETNQGATIEVGGLPDVDKPNLDEVTIPDTSGEITETAATTQQSIDTDNDEAQGTDGMVQSSEHGQEAQPETSESYPYTIEQLLDMVIEKDASDLHVTVGYPVMLRLDGILVPVSDHIVTEEDAPELVLPTLPEQKKELLEVNREVDLAYSHQGKGRFRINAYYQQESLAAAFRLIPNEIRSIDELKLPQIYHQIAKLKQGLVLVTGPTGSGKSTTLAAILQEINQNRPDHIITIEDPIEYILPKGKSMVDQREMHEDTHSWEIALKSALRQDPDVILVGEMRDFDTISSAITLAETGHLVFATLHTNSASQTVDRIIDVFPEHQQPQVRSQLSNTLESVIAQRLIPLDAGGRSAVSEIMIANPAVRNLIREGKTHQLDNVIRTSADIGMISLESSLVKLVRENLITMEKAQEYAVHPEEVVRLLKS